MKKLHLFAAASCIVLGLVLLALNPPGPPVPGPGLSLTLSEKRKAQIEGLSYNLKFELSEKTDEPIPGQVEILFRLKEIPQKADSFTLDFKQDKGAVKSALINGQERFLIHEKGHLVIDETLLVQGKNRIFIQFETKAKSIHRNKEYVFTLFVPDKASQAFPCFDQPDLKAQFELELVVPQDWVAVANTSEKVTPGPLSSQKTYQFSRTRQMSTYLFAFAAGRFLVEKQMIGEQEVRFFFRESDPLRVKRNLAEIFEYHKVSLAWLETYTGIPYPFQKLDFVGIPFFPYGGMEHIGAIFYRESSLFLPKEASSQQRISRASLIAHEVSHMWFGNLVTMKWFDDVWLKEVFANLMAGKIIDPLFPKTQHRLKKFLKHHPRSLVIDRTQGSHPIQQKLENLKDAGSLYGALIYNKAPIMMDQLEERMGKKAFQEALREYLESFSFGNATWDHLVEFFQKKRPDLQLEQWAEVWVKRPGLPHWNIEYQKDSNELVLDQNDSTGGDHRWPQNFRLWIQTGDGTQEESVTYRGVPEKIALNSKSQMLGALLSPEAYGVRSLNGFSKTLSLENMTVEQRATYWLSFWEDVVQNKISPDLFLDQLVSKLDSSENEFLLDYLLGRLKEAFWISYSTQGEVTSSSLLKEKVKTLYLEIDDLSTQKKFFETLVELSLSSKDLEFLEQIIFVKKLKFELDEQDWIDILTELCIRNPNRSSFYFSQIQAKIKNPDQLERLKYLKVSILGTLSEREKFYKTLLEKSQLTQENWVLSAVRNLNHPLRTKESLKFLGPALERLRELSENSTIFFPKSWLDAHLSTHFSKEAAQTLQQFLKNSKNLPPDLRLKVLQSGDHLLRL